MRISDLAAYTTNPHIIIGHRNAETESTFRVRGEIITGNDEVIGEGSEPVSATTLADEVPKLGSVTGNVKDQQAFIFAQGAAITPFTLPEAKDGDNASGYTYTLTDVSGIGLSFNASTRTVSGTPNSAQASAEYTYTATEAGDPDGTGESASVTFTIGVRPGEATGLEVTSDGSYVTLSWTAIAGVDGWEYRKNGGGWTGIAGGGGATSVTLYRPNDASATFAVRAYVGTGDTQLGGESSGAVTATIEIDYDTTSAGLIHSEGGNGLIEISSLAQLQASRLDTNGDGRTDDPGNQDDYDLAFPNAAPNMGCAPRRCHGYELATDDLTPGPGDRGRTHNNDGGPRAPTE